MTNRLLGLPYSFPSWVTALGRVFQLAVMNGRPQRRHKNQVAELQSPVGWNFVPIPAGGEREDQSFAGAVRKAKAVLQFAD